MGFLLYSPLAIYSALCSPAIYLVCVTFLLPAVLDAFCHCLLSPLSSVCSFRLNFLDERLAECEQMPKDVVSQLRLSKWHSLHRYRSALSTGSSSKGAATTPTLANQPSALLDEFDDAASDISTGTCSACFCFFCIHTLAWFVILLLLRYKNVQMCRYRNNYMSCSCFLQEAYLA